MAILHYENLQLPQPELVLRQVFYGLGDIAGYLTRAIAHLERHAVLRASWRELGAEELDDLPEPERLAGLWVELDDAEGSRYDDGKALQAFFDDDVSGVYDRVDLPPARDGSPRFSYAREHRIDVVDRDPRRQRLCLERAPASSEIILRPSTYELHKQLDALRALQNAPHPAHRPLLDLFLAHRLVSWPEVEPEPVAEDEWMLLRARAAGEPLREGTDEQRTFVQIALGTKDFAILEGPPGSGKTTAICELILQELRLERRVLLCASTHVAVDNVIERLMAEDQPFRDEVIPVRIGDRKNISDPVKPWQLEELRRTERERIRRWLRARSKRTRAQATLLKALDRPGDDLISRIILDSANVICGTTIGILQHPDIKQSIEQPHLARTPVFDVLIIDEASKTTFQQLLVPALLARRWILVGDVKQLSPYVDADHIAVNLEAAVPSAAVRNAALDAFEIERFLAAPDDPRRRHLGAAVVVPEDATEREAYRIEAGRRGVALVDLDEEGHGDGWATTLAGIVLGSEAAIRRRAGDLPLDIAVVHGRGAVLAPLRRRASVRVEGEDERSWGGEVGWRIRRSYEKRLLRAGEASATAVDHDLREAWDLVPSEQALHLTQIQPREGRSAQDAAWEVVERVRRVALPSVLDCLQNGFERRQGQRDGTAISDGLPKPDLRSRHVLLKWQHRMHPALSRFPRERIYHREALLDPQDMVTRRAWSDPLWPERILWIDVHGRADGTRNEREAQAVLRELDRFQRWARAHGRPDKKPWEIAVLTFYRQQEKLMRELLRRRLGHHDFDRFTLGPRAQPYAVLDLCTVDRFQGHEADLVLLSFGRTSGVGFLDSPNRLNVALTRARYQLLLIGRRQNFAEQHRSELLRELAALPATYDLRD